MDAHLNEAARISLPRVRHPPPRIQSLLQVIERHRRIVDRNLEGPARWRGWLRRESAGRFDLVARRRVAGAFDFLAALARTDGRLFTDGEFLQELHDRAVGGRELRRSGVRVGKDADFPSPTVVPDLLRNTLREIRESDDPLVVLAARSHLALVLIHPFAEGNGRTARLYAAHLLLCAGYRSTLFTAVEQHFRHDPARYGACIRRAKAGPHGVESWIQSALDAMARSSRAVAWFRRNRPTVSECRRLKPPYADELAFQLGRLRDEERSSRSSKGGARWPE